MEDTQATWKKLITPSNIILIVTLLVGLIAIIARYFLQGVSIIEQSVLACLTLLATAQLATNYSAVKQEEKSNEHHRGQQAIADVIKDFPSGRFKRRKDIVPLVEFTEKAEEILIIARTASKVAGRSDFVQKKLERGCRVRFVIVNPEAYYRNDIEAVTPMPLTGKLALKAFSAEVTSTLENIRSLRKFSENTTGKVEVRLVNYISNLSFIMVDDGHGRGRITVELMPYKCQLDDRPYMELASSDPNTCWYDLFKSACEEIWQHATSLPEQGLR